MIFSPENAKKVMTGEKTQTRRLKDRYRVGQIVAVQPGRTKKGIGKVMITRKWHEPGQKISEADAIAEGCQPGEWTRLYPEGDANPVKVRMSAKAAYHQLWNSINKKRGTHWEDNPDVTAYEFETIL